MIQFGDALRRARLNKGLSRGQLWHRIRAKFDEPVHQDTLKNLEQNPAREPQDWVRAQIVAVLHELR